MKDRTAQKGLTFLSVRGTSSCLTASSCHISFSLVTEKQKEGSCCPPTPTRDLGTCQLPWSQSQPLTVTLLLDTHPIGPLSLENLTNTVRKCHCPLNGALTLPWSESQARSLLPVSPATSKGTAPEAAGLRAGAAERVAEATSLCGTHAGGRADAQAPASCPQRSMLGSAPHMAIQRAPSSVHGFADCCRGAIDPLLCLAKCQAWLAGPTPQHSAHRQPVSPRPTAVSPHTGKQVPQTGSQGLALLLPVWGLGCVIDSWRVTSHRLCSSWRGHTL